MVESDPCLKCQNIRKQTLDDVCDALYRIMPNSDGYETKAFVAELMEEILHD